MICTWVSVGSGNASIVRLRNDTMPQMPSAMAASKIAGRFLRQNSTRAVMVAASLSRLLDCVEEQERAARDDTLTLLHTLEDLDLVVRAMTGANGSALEGALAVVNEDDRLRTVGDDRARWHIQNSLIRIR